MVVEASLLIRRIISCEMPSFSIGDAFVVVKWYKEVLPQI